MRPGGAPRLPCGESRRWARPRGKRALPHPRRRKQPRRRGRRRGSRALEGRSAPLALAEPPSPAARRPQGRPGSAYALTRLRAYAPTRRRAFCAPSSAPAPWDPPPWPQAPGPGPCASAGAGPGAGAASKAPQAQPAPQAPPARASAARACKLRPRRPRRAVRPAGERRSVSACRRSRLFSGSRERPGASKLVAAAPTPPRPQSCHGWVSACWSRRATTALGGVESLGGPADLAASRQAAAAAPPSWAPRRQRALVPPREALSASASAPQALKRCVRAGPAEALLRLAGRSVEPSAPQQPRAFERPRRLPAALLRRAAGGGADAGPDRGN